MSDRPQPMRFEVSTTVIDPNDNVDPDTLADAIQFLLSGISSEQVMPEIEISFDSVRCTFA